MTGKVVGVSTTRWRWALVAAVAAVLVAAPVALTALPASATMAPAALRARVLASISRPYQGYAESTGSLGLPELPNLADVTRLLGGTTRAVLVRGPGALGSTRSPASASATTTGCRRRIRLGLRAEPAHRAGRRPRRSGCRAAEDLLPPELARRVLSRSTGPNRSRPARAARRRHRRRRAARAPTDPETAIGQVDIWADPDTGLPLRVEVTATRPARPGRASPRSGVTVEHAATGRRADPAEALAGLRLHRQRRAGRARRARNAAGSPLPAELAGRPCSAAGSAACRGSAYGTGLASFVVVAAAAPTSASGAVTAMGKAGAKTVPLPIGQGTC